MLPAVILEIIDDYVSGMNFHSDLPPLKAVRRLMDRCDGFVLQLLGKVLGMPSSEVMRLRFRLEMQGEFIFYFHMSADQRQFLLHLLERSVQENCNMSCLTWIFLNREPKLIEIPEYKRLFRDGLFCRLMEYMVTEPPNQVAI